MESKLIIRKAKDGINYEAVIMEFCGEYYEAEKEIGPTPSEAVMALIKGMAATINRLEEYINLCYYGDKEIQY